MDSVRILIILGKSQYGAIDRFAKDLKSGFERNGCIVDWMDGKEITDDIDEKKTLARHKNRKYDFIVNFNAWVIDFWEGYVKDSATVFWGFLLDSPLWHLKRLQFCNRNVIISFIDRNHLAYAERELKNLSYITFMPHGGSRAERIVPYGNRKRQVVFFGTHTGIETYEAQLNSESESLQYLLGKVIHRLYEGEADLTKLLEEELDFEGQKLTEYQRKSIMKHFLYIDALVRNMKRMHLLEILGASGICVEVYGNGWETYVNKYPEYIHICGPVTYDESLEIMGETKIMVNNMPLYADGSHERVFTAMRCGAVVVSEESIYLQEELEDNKEVVFFNYNNLSLLPEKIKFLLNHETEAEGIAKAGRKKAETFHTWENRAEIMLGILFEIKEQQKPWKDAQIPIYSECDELFNGLLFQINGTEEEMLFEIMKEQAVGEALFNAKTFRLKEDALWRQRAGLLKNRVKEFVWLYGRMGDQTSKKVLLVLLQHWLYNTSLDGMPKQCWSQYFDLDVLSFKEEEVFVDCRAYKGETLIDFILACKCYKKVYCYEYDKDDFAQLKEIVSEYSNVIVHPCIVGDKNEEEISMVTLDSDIEEEITFIKADLDGAEKLMLRGSENHIRREKPKLAISIYHGNADILDIPLLIEEMNPDYKFYLRYYGKNLYPEKMIFYAV